MYGHLGGTGETLTGSFVKLQRIVASFDDLRAGAALSFARERTLRRIALELGATVVPTLMRQLGDPSEAAADWAARLVEALADDPSHRPRIRESLRSLLSAGNAAEDTRMRALGILAQFGGEAPAELDADDMSALRDRSLRELARCLDTRAEVARAADLFRSQLDDDELVEFVEEFSESQPDRAAALIDELLVRGDLGEVGRGELRRLRAPLPEPDDLRGADIERTRAAVGAHPDGRVLVVAWLRRPDRRPSRHRILAVEIGVDGALAAADYRPEVSGGAIERNVLRKLRGRGFALADKPVADAASRVGRAARAARCAGAVLPRDYYLGRDILGLVSEHLGGSGEAARNLGALLARAVDLIAAGEYEAARPMLARYVARRPDDSDGRSNLGLCLLVAGDLSAAERHLRKAAELVPDDALPHWNLASVAHRAGRRGGCYLSLIDYLERSDLRIGAEQRRGAAQAFAAEYERLARVEHARVPPARLAHADELRAEARLHLETGAFDAAIEELEQAIRIAPSMHSAWTDLGAAYAHKRLPGDAERCLRRALALCPSDAEARERLDALDQSGRGG